MEENWYSYFMKWIIFAIFVLVMFNVTEQCVCYTNMYALCENDVQYFSMTEHKSFFITYS